MFCDHHHPKLNQSEDYEDRYRAGDHEFDHGCAALVLRVIVGRRFASERHGNGFMAGSEQSWTDSPRRPGALGAGK